MKKIQVLSLIVFAVSVTVFGVYKVHSLTNGDSAGPEIAMNENTIEVSVAAAEEELLAGVTAVDEKDGDVTDTLVVEKMGNFVERGRREITIAAFDSNNHITKSAREIIYTDYHAPRFSLSAPLKFPAGVTNILAYMSAEDVLDGNLTGNIKISGEYTLKADEPGEYPMLFTVSNSAGDVSSLPVTVTIYNPEQESKNPQITLSQYVVYTTIGAAVNPWDYVRAIQMDNRLYERCEDGILRDTAPAEGQTRTEIRPEEVAITQNFDYNAPGVYEITYQIVSADGSVGTMRLIVIVSE